MCSSARDWKICREFRLEIVSPSSQILRGKVMSASGAVILLRHHTTTTRGGGSGEQHPQEQKDDGSMSISMNRRSAPFSMFAMA